MTFHSSNKTKDILQERCEKKSDLYVKDIINLSCIQLRESLHVTFLCVYCSDVTR